MLFANSQYRGRNVSEVHRAGASRLPNKQRRNRVCLSYTSHVRSTVRPKLNRMDSVKRTPKHTTPSLPLATTRSTNWEREDYQTPKSGFRMLSTPTFGHALFCDGHVSRRIIVFNYFVNALRSKDVSVHAPSVLVDFMFTIICGSDIPNFSQFSMLQHIRGQMQ